MIRGRAGDDQIGGGSGLNTLTGGPGHDMFVFNARPDGGSVSRITDFNPTQDLIDFYVGSFKKLQFGVLPAAQFHVGQHAATTTQHIIYNQNTGSLYYDANGNHPGGQELFAILHAHLALTNADFIVT